MPEDSVIAVPTRVLVPPPKSRRHSRSGFWPTGHHRYLSPNESNCREVLSRPLRFGIKIIHTVENPIAEVQKNSWNESQLIAVDSGSGAIYSCTGL